MKRTAVLLCILMLSALPAAALELSLEECLSLAVQNDPALRARQAEEQVRREEVDIALKGFLPTLKLTGDYTLFDRPPRAIIGANSFTPGIPAEDVYLTGDRRFRSASLMLEQPLFTGGRLTENLNKSKFVEEQARLQTKRQQTLLRRDVAELFFQTLAMQAQRQSRERLIQARKERLRTLAVQQSEGYVKADELLRDEAELAMIEAELFRFRSRENVFLAQLKNALFLDAATPLTLKTPDTYLSLSPEAVNLEASALLHRDDYLAVTEQINAAEADVKTARSKLYPQVSMYGQYIRQDENDFSRDEVWAAGARLEWSIFEWGKNMAEIRRAKAEKERLHFQQESYAQAIKNETVELWSTLLEMERMADAWVMKTRSSEATLTRTIAEFNEGRRTLAEILAEEAEFFSHYHNYLATIHEQGMTLSRLQTAVGAPLEAWLVNKPCYQPQVKLFAVAPDNTAAAQLASPTANEVVSDRCEIQLGSFQDFQKADQLKDKAAQRFANQQVVVAKLDGMFKVRITSASDCAQAQKLLPAIRSQLGIKSYLVRIEP